MNHCGFTRQLLISKTLIECNWQLKRSLKIVLKQTLLIDTFVNYLHIRNHYNSGYSITIVTLVRRSTCQRRSEAECVFKANRWLRKTRDLANHRKTDGFIMGPWQTERRHSFARRAMEIADYIDVLLITLDIMSLNTNRLKRLTLIDNIHRKVRKLLAYFKFMVMCFIIWTLIGPICILIINK